jgi:hypothetical protein
MLAAATAVPHSPPSPRRDLLFLLLLGAASGALFFSSLGRLWPLAELDLHVPRRVLIREATAALGARGIEIEGYSAATLIALDAPTLDHVERSASRAKAQRLITDGVPIYRYEVYFKRAGDPDSAWVQWHPTGGVVGWGRTVQEDAPGAQVDGEVARRLAVEALGPRFGLADGAWEERGYSDRLRPARRDHLIYYERMLVPRADLRERITVHVTGDRVTRVERALVAPEEARRQARARRAPIAALQNFGFALAAIAALLAFTVFLTRLRAGTVRLAPAAAWVGVIAACFMITQALEPARLLLAWDPLWPRWVAAFQTLMLAGAGGAWIMLVLFVVIAAGDALDREMGGGRGTALWLAARGRLDHPLVALASARGFLVGLVCGGVLALSMITLEGTVGAWASLQPQGFFFAALNSAAPAISTLLYFLMVALVEELAYRFFAGSWLLAVTGWRTLAVVGPALIYGVTHTGLTFIPPAEPFWGRALAFTAVGCVWGWAFLRYDALTVVFSHWAADLFIFNWPRLASGDPTLVSRSLLTFAVPLLPAIVWGVLRLARRPGSDRGDTAAGAEQAGKSQATGRP